MDNTIYPISTKFNEKSPFQLVFRQLKEYYNFRKKFKAERHFNIGKMFQNEYYLIDKNWLNQWKEFAGYNYFSSLKLNREMNDNDYPYFIQFISQNRNKNKNYLYPLDNSNIYLNNGEINPYAEFVVINKDCHKIFGESKQNLGYNNINEKAVPLKMLKNKNILNISKNIKIICFRDDSDENNKVDMEIIIKLIEEKNQNQFSAIISEIENDDNFIIWLKNREFGMHGPDELEVEEKGCKYRIINKNLKLKLNQLKNCVTPKNKESTTALLIKNSLPKNLLDEIETKMEYYKNEIKKTGLQKGNKTTIRNDQKNPFYTSQPQQPQQNYNNMNDPNKNANFNFMQNNNNNNQIPQQQNFNNGAQFNNINFCCNNNVGNQNIQMNQMNNQNMIQMQMVQGNNMNMMQINQMNMNMNNQNMMQMNKMQMMNSVNNMNFNNNMFMNNMNNNNQNLSIGNANSCPNFQNPNMKLDSQPKQKVENSNVKNNILYPHHAGLVNVGQSCYMNATIECLSNIKSLSNHLIENYGNYNSKTQPLCVSYSSLLYELIFTNKNCIEPKLFKEIIGKLNPLFEGNHAADAKDLIFFIIETLHKELLPPSNNNNENNEIDFLQQEQNAKDENKMLNEFIKEFNLNRTIISDIFYGINRSIMKCNNCGTKKYSFQTFNLLIFPLKKVKEYKMRQIGRGNLDLNLYDAFSCEQEAERLEGENMIYCNVCRQLSPGVHQQQIYGMPRILIIILNRGKNNQDFNEEFRFEEILDFTNKNLVVNNGSIQKFYLCGIITHLGESGDRGHFIAYCRNSFNDCFTCYNDKDVSQASVADTMATKISKKGSERRTPYILIYHYMK